MPRVHLRLTSSQKIGPLDLDQLMRTRQTHQVHQHRGAPERGDQEAHPGGADRPQPGERAAADQVTGNRDARGLNRGAPLPQHGRASSRLQTGQGDPV